MLLRSFLVCPSIMTDILLVVYCIPVANCIHAIAQYILICQPCHSKSNIEIQATVQKYYCNHRFKAEILEKHLERKEWQNTFKKIKSGEMWRFSRNIKDHTFCASSSHSKKMKMCAYISLVKWNFQLQKTKQKKEFTY